jgi:hypothetical protein
MTDESALNIAGKRRHLYLLQKIRENKPLSRTEVAELRQYELAAGKQADQVQPAGPAAPAVPQRLTAAFVREAAMDCATMAAAESRLGIEDLAGRIEKSQTLTKAWEKGRQLRDIRELAVTPICMEEASKKLGLGEDGLAKLYKRDPEVRDLWDRGRVDMLVKAKQGLMDRAVTGSPHALSAVERILRGEFGQAAGSQPGDFTKLSPTQIAEATGFPRQTILRWHKSHGLKRNADGTYNLPEFVEWLREFEVDKVTRTTGTAGQDPLREQKARKAKIEADLAEGRVILKEQHIRTLMTQAAWLVQLLSEAKAEEWAALHEGLTALQLKERYMDAFWALRSQWCMLPAEVPMSPAARAKFEEAFELMKGSS